MFSYIKLALKGFCMGAADVVPGVSGGTMAFILGIYEELILAIRSFDLTFAKLALSLKFREALEHVNWKFLLALGLGILTAILSLAKGLSWLLTNQPVMIWSFFFGLVLASVLTVRTRVSRWTVGLVAAAIIAAIAAFFLVGLTPVSTPETWWFLFLSGAVAICAMILPGISGAFILVLLGKYHFVLEAVNQRNLPPLIIVAAGAVVGIIIFSRLLGWLFKNHHDLVVAVLCGLMLGSLRKVWPWKLDGVNIWPAGLNSEVFIALGLAVLGVIVVAALDRAARRQGP